jgi:hypothetical protein
MNDEDDWVRMAGQLFERVPETGKIELEDVDKLTSIQGLLSTARQKLEENGVRFHREEEAYLHECTSHVNMMDDHKRRLSIQKSTRPLANIRSSEGVITREERERRFSLLITTATPTSAGGPGVTRPRPTAGSTSSGAGLFMPRRATVGARPGPSKQTPSFLRTGVQRPRVTTTARSK